MAKSAERYAVPTANLRVLLEIARERRVPAEKLLQGTALTIAALADPALRVPAREAARFVANACAATGDPGLGFEFGLRGKPTTHGHMGYAAMTCATLREALELVARYLHLRQRDVALRVTVDAEHVVLHASDTHAVGAARRFIHEAMMTSLWRMSGFLIGEPRPQAEIWFDWREPSYHARFASRLPRVRYGMDCVQLRMPVAYLDRPLTMAEPEAVKHAVAELEREAALHGDDTGNLAERVRAQLKRGNAGYPQLGQVAAKLCTSERSLKRKLARSGTSFKALLDEARYRDARALLADPALEVQQIASALGYTDPPSFTRAFRRWSGVTPSATRVNRG